MTRTYSEVQNDLINGVLAAQPDDSHEIGIECGSFVSHFGVIFSLSYDLYLRHTLHVNGSSTRKKYQDGFEVNAAHGKRGFNPGRRGKNVYYLHGALNLFSDGEKPEDNYLVCYNRSALKGKNPARIVPQVRQMIAQGKRPVFVAHVTAEMKKQEIRKQKYLNECFDALGKLDRDLLVFGSSIQSTDGHIWEAISNSPARRVYVSFLANSGDLEDLRYRARKFIKKDLTFVSVDATDPIWISCKKPVRQKPQFR